MTKLEFCKAIILRSLALQTIIGRDPFEDCENPDDRKQSIMDASKVVDKIVNFRDKCDRLSYFEVKILNSYVGHDIVPLYEVLDYLNLLNTNAFVKERKDKDAISISQFIDEPLFEFYNSENGVMTQLKVSDILESLH